MSTPSELGLIAAKVLEWVAAARAQQRPNLDGRATLMLSDDDLRRIELCAQATQESSMLVTMLGTADLPELGEPCTCTRWCEGTAALTEGVYCWMSA